MLQVNLEVCSEILNSVRVNFFHLQPVVRIGLASWLNKAGVRNFSDKASVTELLDSRDNEIFLLDIESIQNLTTHSYQRLELCASETVVVTTRKQLNRHGQLLPENIGGLISPRSDLDNFVRAIAALTNQRTYVDPILSASWNSLLLEPRVNLTNRQLEILRLVAVGKTSVQIAGLLGVRPKTVENHRAAIKQRMGVVSAAQMVNQAHVRGIC